MKLEEIKKSILKLGFTENTKIIEGFKPHFIKGNDVLFLIGSTFWGRKIGRISNAYKNKDIKVYGVMTDNAPRAADKDWVTANNFSFTLLKLNPLRFARWNKEGSGLEYVEAF